MFLLLLLELLVASLLLLMALLSVLKVLCSLLLLFDLQGTVFAGGHVKSAVQVTSSNNESVGFIFIVHGGWRCSAAAVDLKNKI
jgi:membrane protein implicated in regulation of membrane protease activity